MELIYKEEVLELKYTFNSFRYMEELDLGELAELERKPFKMISIGETLLLGALNYNPKVKYTPQMVSEIMEEEVNNGNMVELIGNLVELLQESSFFKNLQKTNVPKKKK